MKWWFGSFQNIEDNLNCEIIYCLPEVKLAEIQKWSDLDHYFWFPNLTIIDITNSISRISWNFFQIDQHMAVIYVKKQKTCCVLWCFTVEKPEVFRHSNKNEQAQNYTFLDDFSKQLEKIVTFRLLQGASSIYYP